MTLWGQQEGQFEGDAYFSEEKRRGGRQRAADEGAEDGEPSVASVAGALSGNGEVGGRA